MQRDRSKAAIVATAVVALMLAVAPAALAQSSSVNSYGGSGGEVQSELAGGNVADEAASGSRQAPAAEPVRFDSSGSLPFTGLDIGLAIGGGLLLIGVGAAMARMVPRTSES